MVRKNAERLKKPLHALKEKKRPKLVVVAVIAVIGVAALIFAKAATPTATLSLTPSSGTYNNGSTITMGVYEDSGTNQASAVDIGLVYDTTKLQYVSTDTTGSSFTLASPAAASGGTLVVTSYVNPGTIPSGNLVGKQLIATVNFKVLVGTGSTNITFLKEAASATSKSAVYLYKTTTNMWDGVTTAGSYTLTTPDTTGPVISASTPANGATVNGTVNVTSTVTDAQSTIASATLAINGATPVPMTAGASNSYSYSWNTTAVADGSYTLQVKATDSAGNPTTETLRTVNVLNAKPDLAVTSVTLTPAAPKVGDVVTLSAVVKNQGALATTAGLANVTGFTMDSASVGTPSNTSAIATGGTITATATWTAVTGSHSLVVAADKNGVITESNESNNTNTITFSVAAPDTTAPAFSGGITLSPSTSPLVGTVTASASATDGGSGMAKIEFYVDGTLKASDTSSPYSFAWDTTTVGDGSHTIYAKAYDVANNNSQSATTTVTIKNIPTPGDTSGDGLVNATDLVNGVLNHWQMTGQSRVNGDLTGDGVVNIQDLLQVLNNWSS